MVIPAYNAEDYLGAQLSALENQVQAGPFEVIVVDNLSTDRTVEVAERYRGTLDLRIVAASERRSAAHARNVGIREARGELIVFVDADDIVDSSLLAAYRRHAKRYRIMGGPYEETLLNDPEVSAWRPSMTPDGLPCLSRKGAALPGGERGHPSVRLRRPRRVRRFAHPFRR